jgi:hypothetical protein
MLHPVSRLLQPDIRFFQHPTPFRHRHALRLTCLYGNGDGVPTFYTVDPVDDLGAPSTPVVRQFRAGS